MKFSTKIKKISLLSLVFLMTFNFSGCIFKDTTPTVKVDLEVWGVFDETVDYSDIFRAYRETNPFVGDIRYRKFSTAEYKKELIDALAAGSGPDVFMINNSWIAEFENKVSVAPDSVLAEKQFRENFVDAVAIDFLSAERKVLATPLSADSLALYYNKDIFNANGITSPPKDWDEFIDVARKTTRINEFGDIVQSGAAMGSVNNINRSTDIINLLLFQNGVDMPTRENQMINLTRTAQSDGSAVSSGSNAIDFYTRFANPSTPTYSWSIDESTHYSLDEFYEGDLAMMINFSWHYETIKSKNSKLNFAIAPVPQLNVNNPVNIANYWGFAVSKNKIIKNKLVSNETRVHEAWQFLKFLTTRNNGSFNIISPVTGAVKPFKVEIDPAKAYLENTNKPAARRDLIEEQKSDPFLGSFAEGNLIAKSWIRMNPELIEGVWASVIGDINRGNISVGQSVDVLRNRINRLLK
ncbi:ABC transporter substrate-binding protein [Patescibacteria group bacterium]